MNIDQRVLDFYQHHLGYNDEEMTLFKEDPKNTKVLSRAPGLIEKTIVAEVIESAGCSSHHKQGDKFYFDGTGNLITGLNPKRVYIFALQPLSGMIYGLHELYYAGHDYPQPAFTRTGCFDVGVKCGGWGHIVMEIKMEDRAKLLF